MVGSSSHVDRIRSVTDRTSKHRADAPLKANGLQTIASQLPLPVESVLDWFLISMRVRYLDH
jgi:hypothetical protein